MNKLLEDFKAFRAFKADLIAAYGNDLLNAKDDYVEVAYTSDVVNAIKKYRSGAITMQTLVDWVNAIWFYDGLFDYCEEQCDSIASVMDLLEELDEEGVSYTDDEYDRMIAALESNIEYE
jgi:hypothetical protein